MFSVDLIIENCANIENGIDLLIKELNLVVLKGRRFRIGLDSEVLVREDIRNQRFGLLEDRRSQQRLVVGFCFLGGFELGLATNLLAFSLSKQKIKQLKEEILQVGD
jgi:hypothetical protein